MPDTITLSEGAVAVLRFEIKGYRSRVEGRRLAAYRELADAGIMEPVPDSECKFRFTPAGWARRVEILDAALASLRRLQPRLPERIDLSEAAWALLRLRMSSERVEVTPDNLEAHRELAATGIMYPVSTFARGPDSLFRFTDQGWIRGQEILARPVEAP